jgi:hypothetical protein
MLLKDHKSRLVRGAIIALLPALAVLCPDAFARAHLDETVEFLQKCSRIAELRPQVLISTGKLSLAVGPQLVARIEQLMSIIKDSFVLQTKKIGGRHSEVSPEALLCISDMVQGLGAPFHERVLSLLEPMLQSGLTAELIETLSIISTYMPNQRPMLQVRLLEEATKVLGGDVKPVLEEPDFVYSWAKKGIRLPKNLNLQLMAMNGESPRDVNGRPYGTVGTPGGLSSGGSTPGIGHPSTPGGMQQVVIQFLVFVCVHTPFILVLLHGLSERDGQLGALGLRSEYGQHEQLRQAPRLHAAASQRVSGGQSGRDRRWSLQTATKRHQEAHLQLQRRLQQQDGGGECGCGRGGAGG